MDVGSGLFRKEQGGNESHFLFFGNLIRMGKQLHLLTTPRVQLSQYHISWFYFCFITYHYMFTCLIVYSLSLFSALENKLQDKKDLACLTYCCSPHV